MKEEIKEILEYLKIENGTIGSELSYEETHLLLDYITNLQEEIERQSKAQVILDNMLADYKSKNEKAIEYIKQHCELVRFEDEGVDMIGKVEGIPLLNILQGEDTKESEVN